MITLLNWWQKQRAGFDTYIFISQISNELYLWKAGSTAPQITGAAVYCVCLHAIMIKGYPDLPLCFESNGERTGR